MPELEEYDIDFSLPQSRQILNEKCQFCGKSKPPGQEDVDFWEPTECLHACCSQCARKQYHPKTLADLCYALCPVCDGEESLRN
jgi:hypothetical protein